MILLASCLAPFFPRVLPTHTPAKACCKKQARAGGGVLAAPASTRLNAAAARRLNRPARAAYDAATVGACVEASSGAETPRLCCATWRPRVAAGAPQHLGHVCLEILSHLCHGRPSTAATCTAVPHSSHASAILWRVVLTACHAVQAPRSCRSPPARASAPRTDDVRASPTHDYSRLN